MEYVQLIISNKKANYENLLIADSIVLQSEDDLRTTDEKNVGSGDHKKDIQRCLLLHWDGILTYYIVSELKISQQYRRIFIKLVKKRLARQVMIKLVEVQKQIIDYKWNEITNYSSWERLELDHALSWLSTLGGAFSALGDYFPNAAQMAGKISQHQFKLALRLGDPNVQSRCRLFMSLSLIQQGHLEIAKNIIYSEYKAAKSATVVDNRLVKMCLGIWAKLKYEWHRKKLSAIIV